MALGLAPRVTHGHREGRGSARLSIPRARQGPYEPPHQSDAALLPSSLLNGLGFRGVPGEGWDGRILYR